MIDQTSFIGQRFGKLVCIAIGEPFITKAGYAVKRMVCKCDCGRDKTIRCQHLKTGASESCGICCKEDRIKHGHARRGERFPKTYRVWRVMLRRCNEPTFPKYPDYGGRGIKVCSRWLDYTSFLTDMGECPSEKHSIHRKDNDKGYEPDNCKWADDFEQANNKRNTVKYTVNGITGTAVQLCRHFIVPYRRTLSRLRRGSTIEQALFDPLGSPMRGVK